MLQEKGEVPPPHLGVVPPGLYIPEQKCFEEPALKAFDKLLPKGYNYGRCDEYHIGQCACILCAH